MDNLVERKFRHVRLDVFRAELYLRSFRARLLYWDLIWHVCFTALFIGLILVILPADTANQHATQLAGEGALLNIIQLGSDESAFLAINTHGDFYRWIREKLLPLLEPGSTLAGYM
eukprot:tig00020693_g13045.t1